MTTKKENKNVAFMTEINSLTKKEPKSEVMPEIAKPAKRSFVLPKKEEKEIVDRDKFKQPTIWDKISCGNKEDDYYSDCPIQPGVNFIKKIFSDEDTNKNIRHLRINIPETFWEMYYVCNDPKQNNDLTVTILNIQRQFSFYETIVNIEENEYQRKFTNMDPFAVVLTYSSASKNNISVERFENAAKKLKDNGEGIMQRFIRSRGRNRDLLKNQTTKEQPQVKIKAKESFNNTHLTREPSQLLPDFKFTESAIQPDKKDKHHLYDFISPVEHEPKKILTKPSIIRLKCKTRYNESKKPNVAYYIINKLPLEHVLKETSKEHTKVILENYSKLTTINLEDKNSYEIYIMSGESLKPYEYYANQLINYVQKYYKLFLKEIIVDFVRDERGIIYFLGVKGFTKLFDKKEDYMRNIAVTKDYLNNEANVKKIYKTLTCRLCTLPYPKSKITKMVTFKLLMRLKENLSKRGTDLVIVSL